MNTNEARFILKARSPDGRDDANPPFTEALEQARRDPALAAWLAHEQAFDATVAARLREVTPPAGLRDAILAGARMVRPTPWWREARVLMMAAGFAVLLGLAATWGAGQIAPSGERLVRGAMADWARDDHHMEPLGGTGALRAAVMREGVRFANGLGLSFDEMKAGGCRVIRIAGREVMEVCFMHESAGELHLYVARRGDFGGAKLETVPMFRERESLASVAWADERYAYVMVSDAGTEALRAAL
jgi:anti-sigma factor RsiW